MVNDCCESSNVQEVSRGRKWLSMSEKGTMVVRLTPLTVMPKLRLPTAVRHHKKSCSVCRSAKSGQHRQTLS